MKYVRNLILKKIKKQKINRVKLRSNFLIGCNSRMFLRKKIAINFNHPLGGLGGDLFLNLQKHMKNLPNFINQNKIKEESISKIKKIQGYKSTRLLKNLPLRGQRTHTNAKTRKKRNVF